MIGWSNIRIPTILVDEEERFIKTSYAQSLGYRNKTEVSVSAFRNFLEKNSRYMAFLKLVGIEDNKIILDDAKIDSVIEVEVRNHHFYCNHDKIDNCVHVDFVLLMPKFHMEKYHDEQTSNITIPEKLMEEINSFIRTTHAKQLGYKKKNEVSTVATRGFLDSADIKRSYLKLLDMVDDDGKIVIHDYNINTIVEVMYRKGKVMCDEDFTDDCDHVKFALMIPRFVKSLKDNGVKIPQIK